MGRSDNYRAKKVQTVAFNLQKFQSDMKVRNTQQTLADSAKNQRKSLYQESADRRKRAAAPEARTSVYTVAPQIDPNMLNRQGYRGSVRQMGVGSSLNRDERFKKLNQKLTQLSQKKKATKKGGVSIEGRGLV
ncbi:unnamed protein product [Ambrosiozyma monospora]|uniref:Unnamed protein product n=1 Tax=Ambrosiozyma monospora TaxID=43982 RepID=A0ACB5T049_AMBMO|nr:unnamed protein product [Ambrosiozyma monospora]